jgi:hypothetical protein
MTEARDTVATWIRIGLVALAVPQLFVGAWAILDPSGWYDSFPGFGADLVAADGPYNMHLATDAGAGFLATSVVLVLGALWGRRREVAMALLSYTAFAVPHFTYHALHDAPGLTSSEDAQSVLSLAFGAGAPVVLLVVLWRTWDRQGATRPDVVAVG